MNLEFGINVDRRRIQLTPCEWGFEKNVRTCRDDITLGSGLYNVVLNKPLTEFLIHS